MINMNVTSDDGSLQIELPDHLVISHLNLQTVVCYHPYRQGQIIGTCRGSHVNQLIKSKPSFKSVKDLRPCYDERKICDLTNGTAQYSFENGWKSVSFYPHDFDDGLLYASDGADNIFMFLERLKLTEENPIPFVLVRYNLFPLDIYNPR